MVAISTGVLIAFAVVGALGFLLGFSKGLFRSLLDIGFTALNIIISVLIATAIAKNIVDVNAISDAVSSIAPNLGQETVDQINYYLTSPELSSKAVALVMALVTVVILPLVFLVVYLVLGIVLFIPKFIIQKLLIHKTKGIGMKLGGGAIGLVTKLVSFAVLLVPIIGYLNYASDTINYAMEAMPEESGTEIHQVADMLNETKESTALNLVQSLGGEALFKNLTTINVDDVKVSLTDETKNAISLYKETTYFSKAPLAEYGQEQVEAIERIEELINNAEFLPALLSNSIAFVATEWTNGNTVFGAEKPQIGTELQDALDSTLEVLSNTTPSDFKADVCTVAEIFKNAIDDGAIQAVASEDGNILYVLENTDIISDLLAELHKNERTRPILPALTNGIVNYMYCIYDEVNGTVTEPHEMVDISTLTEEEVRKEGQVIVKVLVEIDTFLKSVEGKMDGDVIDILESGDFAALGRGFNAIKTSYLFCDSFEFMLRTVLESKGCAQLGILDDQFITNAIKHDSDMEMMLVARQKITLMVMSLHKGNDIEYSDAIGALLANVSTGDADSIKSIVTEENLKELGVGGEQAHTISGLLTSMVDSINKEELEIAPENIEKESESAGKVLTAVNSALENSAKDKNVFTSSTEGDTTESTSNMSASEFVSTTLESELVSSMVVEATKDENGNEVDDPYNVKEHLSENDISELESVLAEEYGKMEEGDDAKKEKLDAIAHIFGIDISAYQ